MDQKITSYGSAKQTKEFFTLSVNEIERAKKKMGSLQVFFAILYKIYKNTREIPKDWHNIPRQVLQQVAKQLEVKTPRPRKITARTQRRWVEEIRQLLSFQKITHQDKQAIQSWLVTEVLAKSHDLEYIKECLHDHLQQQNFERLDAQEEKKWIQAAIHRFEKELFLKISQMLTETSRTTISQWLTSQLDAAAEENGWVSFAEMKKNPGSIGVNSVFEELAKLNTINRFALPKQLFSSLSAKVVRKYYQRARVQGIWELKRFPPETRYALLTIFFCVKKQVIIDDLVELLIQIVHKIQINADKKVEKALVKEVKKIYGKEKILLEISIASLNHPEDRIEEVIYPVVGGTKRLKALIADLRAKRKYNDQVHSLVRRSYSCHYRQMIPKLLDAIEFQCNQSDYQPLTEAISLIKKHIRSRKKYFPANETVPIKGVITKQFVPIVVDKEKKKRINRINYEICALQALRERLRCKEIWVMGANRYRNPDEDLPADFEKNKFAYYSNLNLPPSATEFIAQLKMQLKQSLMELNANIPVNRKVRIVTKNKGRIVLTPLEAQANPPHLTKVKAQLFLRWPMVSLLDVLKETFLRLPLTKHFKTIASREMLPALLLQKRLILTIYGIGTNTGLKRIAVGNRETNMKNLFHVYQNYLSKDNLRAAITELVNQQLCIRDPKIWGTATTACASDSKQFGAWDQNLMTEWHNRYHGRGIMIYWHVEENSLCIYSQLKKCSSSEVSAMIEGVLHHCTNMEVEKNYVDSHGQSALAFAFCYLLGFKLLPRLKAIAAQKLYLPEVGLSLPNLTPILAKDPINWPLIAQQYNQMVKYATALKLGTAETEAILKRFMKENNKHPTYLALCELGKVDKTNFICNYLISEELRTEIHEGLNVIESWNSCNHFVIFGKGHEFASNHFDVQEITALCLHLIQNCIVYINTLMLQEIFGEKKWLELMTAEDFRALTPLLYEHITPYGSFRLDMKQRLDLVAL